MDLHCLTYSMHVHPMTIPVHKLILTIQGFYINKYLVVPGINTTDGPVHYIDNSDRVSDIFEHRYPNHWDSDSNQVHLQQ